jgi:hypothetical protein
MARYRNIQVQFRVSVSELEELNKNIKKSDLKKSVFLRKVAIENEVIVLEGLDEMVAQVKKIGVNINQIARVLNSGSYFDYSKDLQLTKKELNKIWQVLSLLAQKVQ